MAQRIVGLDIGTSAVRAVELTVDPGSLPVLEAFGQVGIPPGSVVDGEVRDRSQVVKAIQRVWREGGFKERRVVLGVAGLRAITREVDMPPLPPDELDDAVRFQADQVVPFPMDQTMFSSKVITQYTDADGSPQLRVLVAAAHRELVDGLVRTVREAGLEPVGIDLDTAALARALFDPSAGNGAEVVVSVGAGLTLVVVHQGGRLQFVRTIDLGGESVTKAIASALDLPLIDAEQIKRRLSRNEPTDTRAESAVRATVAELVGEIHNSVRFYTAQPGRSSPTRILVTGGGARTAGFFDALQQGIDIPVLPASPLSHVDISRLGISPEQAAAIDPTLAVPVGLALPDPSGKPFNLLPAEVTAAYTEQRVRKALLLVGAVVLLLLAAGTAWRIVAVHNAENRVATLQHQLDYINKVEVPKYDKVVSIQSQIRSLQQKDKPLVTGETNWLTVLNQFGQYLPSTAVLSTLSLTDTAGVGTTGSKSSTSTSKTSTAAVTVARGTAKVDVANYTAFSQFGDTMAQSPAITLGAPSVSLTNGATIDFSVTFTIGKTAEGQPDGLLTQAAP